MYWIFKLLVWNVRRRGLIRYWWTGHSYPFFRGYRLARKSVWDRELRDSVPFDGSVFRHCLKIAVKGKLNSWRSLFRVEVWDRLFELMEILKED